MIIEKNIIVGIIAVCFASCGFNLRKTLRIVGSDTIEESVINNAFLWEYQCEDTIIIKGKTKIAIKECFAEKCYNYAGYDTDDLIVHDSCYKTIVSLTSDCGDINQSGKKDQWSFNGFEPHGWMVFCANKIIPADTLVFNIYDKAKEQKEEIGRFICVRKR